MTQNYTDNIPAWGNRVDDDVEKMANNFAALKSSFSGPSAPSNPVAGMWWYDTTAHILKVRNEANNAWLSVWDLANNKPVIANLSNEITGAMINSSLKSPAAGVEGLRRLGTGATEACAGNDARLSDARRPTGSAVVTQSMLKTATAENAVRVSYPTGGTGVAITEYISPTGAAYMFGGVAFKMVSISGGLPASLSSTFYGGGIFDATSYAYSAMHYVRGTGGESGTADGYARWNYVNSSGELSWLFIKRDKVTKQIVAMNLADNHPCFATTCDPEKTPHPFLSVKDTEEVICCVIPDDQWEDICDKAEDYEDSRLQALCDLYEIDEDSKPAWPTKAVTVGLPKKIKVKGKMVIADWRHIPIGTEVTPIKKVIPKMNNLIAKSLRKKR
jgi:hypothetical protein